MDPKRFDPELLRRTLADDFALREETDDDEEEDGDGDEGSGHRDDDDDEPDTDGYSE